MKHHLIEVLAHKELPEADLAELRQRFDGEHLEEFGTWGPDQPYGYPSRDFHVVARIEGRLAGRSYVRPERQRDVFSKIVDTTIRIRAGLPVS